MKACDLPSEDKYLTSGTFYTDHQPKSHPNDELFKIKYLNITRNNPQHKSQVLMIYVRLFTISNFHLKNV